MSTKMRVILVRHGDAVGTKGKFHGLVDNPLTESGRREAETTANHLKDEGIEQIYSSPMVRALDTAKIIGDKLKIPVQTDKALLPWDLGSYVGKPVDSQYLEKVKHHIRNSNSKVPSGQSFDKFAGRYIPFINKLLNDKSKKTVAVVTHGRNILLTKAEQKTGIDNNRFEKSVMLDNDKSTEHGGYAIADGTRFSLKTPKNVKAGES